MCHHELYHCTRHRYIFYWFTTGFFFIPCLIYFMYLWYFPEMAIFRILPGVENTQRIMIISRRLLILHAQLDCFHLQDILCNLDRYILLPFPSPLFRVFFCFLICFALFTDKINFRSLSHNIQRLTDMIKNSKKLWTSISTTGPN